MAQISEMFKNGPNKIETLWRLSGDNRLSSDERESLAFAVMAVQFAMRPLMVHDFNSFLANWPNVLTDEEKLRIE
jgi:hypothetical protein